MNVAIDTLTREAAARHSTALLSLGADLDWHTWTSDQLLADRPEKWHRSLVASARATEPVGYVVASRGPDAVHLHQIVVGPTVRGTGIGRLLVGRLLAEAGRDGISRVTLKVSRENGRAIAFYGRLGFETYGTDEHGQLEMAAPTGA